MQQHVYVFKQVHICVKHYYIRLISSLGHVFVA